MTIEIRMAAGDDILAIMERRTEFIYEIMRHEIPPEIRETTIEYLEEYIDSDSLVCYIAAEDHKIISMAILCIYQVIPKLHNRTGKAGNILNVFTLKEYRGRGLAKQLLDKVIETAKSRNVKEIYLKAEQKAVPLYERLGFKCAEREMILKLE